MAQSIPIIDMRVAQSDPAAFAEQLGAGFGDVGFVGLTNHGVDEALVQRAYGLFSDFFGLSKAAKMNYHLAGAGGARGYTAFGVEHAKGASEVDLKEFWQVGRSMAEDHELAAMYPRNPWPDAEVAGFSDVGRGLFEQLEATAMVVLRGVASSLGLGADWFESRVNYGNSILRAIHYPPIQGEPAGVRAAPHEDINVITLLVGSGAPGLEIKKHDGEWVPVTTIPGTIVCNVGDMLQRLTNHRMHSMTHQVRNPPAPWCDQSRYSIPFFMHFNSDVSIETLPQCISADAPNRYPTPISADAYLKQRLVEIGLLVAED